MSVISQFFFNTFRALITILPDALFSKVALLIKGDTVTTSLPANAGLMLDSSTQLSPIVKTGTPAHNKFSPYGFNNWSTQFDGSSYFLLGTGGVTPNLTIGTQDFTWECWTNHTTQVSTVYFIFGVRGSGADNTCPYLVLTPTGYSFGTDGTTIATTSIGAIPTNTWNHVAVVRSGTGTNNVKIYVNGAQAGQGTSNLNFSSTNAPFIGHANGASPYNFIGHMSNFRAVIGTAVYTGAFTPSTAPLSAVVGTQFLGLNSQTHKDNSSANLAFTVTGTPVVNAFSPFNVTEAVYSAAANRSTYFNGSSFVAFDNSVTGRFTLGTADATIEFWLNYQSAGVVCGTYRWNIGARGGWQVSVAANGAIDISHNGGNSAVSSAGCVGSNAWTHVAITKTGSTVNFWKNGQLFSTSTTLVNLAGPSATPNYLRIGAHTTDGDAIESALTGYISDLKISNVVRYNGSFSPIKATSDANTLLLACAGDTFADQSPAALIPIELRGSPVTSAVSPFQDLGTSTLVTGSTYFKGSTDVVQFTNPLLATGTGAFTVETWIYPTAWNGCLTSSWFSTNNGNGFYLGLTSTGTVEFLIGNGSGAAGVTSNVCTSSIIVPKSAWTHLAATRSAGGAMTIYINGNQAATTTTSRSVDKTIAFINATYINAPVLSANTVSYSGFRVSNIARSSFNLNTPVSPDANTLFQLGCNPAVIDSVAGSQMFEVGTVPTSTSQFKFGGSSILLNGATSNKLVFAPNSQSVIFGSGDFTVEAWVYPFVQSGSQILFLGQGDAASAAGSSNVMYISATGASSEIYVGSSAGASAVSPNPPALTWSHVAYVRNGTSWKTYLNGAQVGSATLGAGATMNVGSTAVPASIGYAVGVNQFSGFIDDFRVTKG